MEFERRSYKVELRADSKSGMPVMMGRAAVFNTLSSIMQDEDGVRFQERILPGAFRDVIVSDDCRALFNHDHNLILARCSSKTLRLMETDEGLEFEIDPPDTSYARDLQVSMSRRDITECSFGFRVAVGGESWSRDPETGMAIRSISKFGKLYDVSPVTYAAYGNTNCATRSLKEFITAEKRDHEAAEAAKVPPYNPNPVLNLRMQLESSLN